MNTLQRIARNTGLLLVSQIVSYILGFFYIMYTARYLGAEGFGILSFALAFTGIFGIFTDLGLETLTIREVARNKNLAQKYFGNIVLMKVILVIITFGLIALFINVLSYPEQTIKVVYLVALSVVFGAFSRVFYSIFQAYEKMEYVAVGRILNSALMLSGALFAISYGFDVVSFATLYFIISLVILMYSFIVCVWKLFLPKIEVDFGFWEPTIKEALPFGLAGIFVTIYYWIDSVMLSIMQGNEIVGWYNAAYRVVLILLFIPTILNVTLLPSMSRLHYSSQNTLELIFKKYLKLMIVIGIPIGLAITLLANRLILLLFGIEYIQSVIALQILIWSMVFIFTNAPFMVLFTSTNHQKIITKITATSMVINIILNFLLIPKFSYIGASGATVITEFIVIMLAVVYSNKNGYSFQKMQFVWIMSKVIIVSIIMGIFIWYCESLNLLVLILLATSLYIGVLHLIGGIDEEDISMLMQMKGV